MDNITLIILAAGQGSRLRPETDNKPKCMVDVNGKPMIQHQIEVARSCGIKKIIVVRGYCGNKIMLDDVIFIDNPEFETTNMVRTLFCAKKYINSPVIISYGDIIYNSDVLDSLISSVSEISVVVDNDWKHYWKLRFDDVLDDAETLKINDKGDIIEIGQKPKSVSEIQGQYIGMIKIQNKAIDLLNALYDKELKQHKYGKKFVSSVRNLNQLYMTDMLEALIRLGNIIRPVWINGGWLEVDDALDLKIARRATSSKKQDFYIDRHY